MGRCPYCLSDSCESWLDEERRRQVRRAKLKRLIAWWFCSPAILLCWASNKLMDVFDMSDAYYGCNCSSCRYARAKMRQRIFKLICLPITCCRWLLLKLWDAIPP